MCVCLLGGYGTAYAAANKHSFCYSPVQAHEKNQVAKNLSVGQDFLFTNDNSSDDDGTYLNSVDDRDEDEEVVKKPVLLFRSVFAFVHAFLFDPHHSRPANGLSHDDQRSLPGTDICIVQ
ncbi:MAG TPA: hypothetical protein VFL47_10055, partial [Flavisolibacter sp.]|nr:hypothetical protein [Flavisolibacter sp.]